MNWINISSTLAIAVSFFVFVQGLSILRVAGTDHVKRIIGSLTVVLAIQGVLTIALFLSTEIVLSPEFGAIIIQGPWTLFFFDLFLLGLILCIVWGWDLARLRAKWQPLGLKLHALGLFAWAISLVLLLGRVNSPAFDAPPIYLYDIWWPSLPLWFIVGFTNIALTILRVSSVTFRVLITGLVVVFASLMILFPARPTTDFVNSLTPTLWIGLFVISGTMLFVSLAVMFFRWLFQLRKPFVTELKDQEALRGQLEELKSFASHIEREQIFMLLSLFLIVLGLMVLLFISSTRVGPAPGILLGPGPGLILIALGWGAITEVITDGWFANLYRGAQSGKWSGPLEKASTVARSSIRTTGERLGGILSLPPNWIAVVKLLLVVALLTVANEVLNYRRTIVQSFQGIGIDDPTSLVDSVDDRLINELAQLNQQLQPAILLPTSSTLGSRIDYIQTSNAASSLDAVLTNSGELEFGGVKIPANVIVSPLQGMVRPWFQVRVVTGNVILDNNGYVLLANASNGGTWSADVPGQQSLDLALPKLAKKLSFVMISSTESLQSYGLTNDWDAFERFQAGIKEIQTYESKGDSDALGRAIRAFKTATLTDTNFALAYYRLGLALQQNRQPWQAETALRTALSLKPDSVAFKNALAYHFYFYYDYAPTHPAVIPITTVPYAESRKQQDQAIRLWHQIVNLPAAEVPATELASAYSGLCRDGLDQAAATQADPQLNPNVGAQDGLLTYFYCYKSQTLLERLPNTLYAQDKIRQAVAENLNNLGLIIDWYSSGGLLTGWQCLPFDISEETGMLSESVTYGYSRSGLQYYQKALQLRPQDIYIQCNAAINAKLLENPALMDDLERNPQAHYELANRYLMRARRQSADSTEPSPYYWAAMQEYQKAIDLDPMYHEALNGYAYTYWIFRLRWPDKSLESLGVDPIESLAEYYAGKALHLARVQQDKELEVQYGSTLAEVLLAKGEPQRAMQVLLDLGIRPDLDSKIPQSYMFDEVRWDMAQAYLCSIDETREGFSKDEMEAQAEAYLSEIREHERLLEIRLFSQLGKDWLQTSYRLPFCSPASSP